MPGYASRYLETAPTRAALDASADTLLLEFGAPWCGYCQAAQPALEALLAGYPALQHLKVEDGRGKLLGRSFRVKLWPTLVVLRQGQELARVVRPASAADLQPLHEALARG